MQRLIAAGVALLVPGMASAAEFLDRTSFSAGLSSSATETFEGVPAGSKGTHFTFSNGSLAAANGVFVTASPGSCATGACVNPVIARSAGSRPARRASAST